MRRREPTAPRQNRVSLALLAEQRTRIARIRPPRVPAHDIKPSPTPSIDIGTRIADQPDTTLTRTSRVEEHRADPPTRSAGEMADHRQRDLGAARVQRTPGLPAPQRTHAPPSKTDGIATGHAPLRLNTNKDPGNRGEVRLTEREPRYQGCHATDKTPESRGVTSKLAVSPGASEPTFPSSVESVPGDPTGVPARLGPLVTNWAEIDSRGHDEG